MLDPVQPLEYETGLLFHKVGVLLLVEPGVPLYLTGNPNEEDFSRLALQWQPPRELNGDILKYRIYYSRYASDHKWKYVDVNGMELRKEITGLKAGTTYYFKIQARTKNCLLYTSPSPRDA